MASLSAAIAAVAVAAGVASSGSGSSLRCDGEVSSVAASLRGALRFVVGAAAEDAGPGRDKSAMCIGWWCA